MFLTCLLITESSVLGCSLVYALMATVGLVWLILLSIAVRVILISRQEYLDDDGFPRRREDLWDDYTGLPR